MTKGLIGVGGAPTRATILPEDPQERKKYPVATGVMDYFPDALAVISNVSWQGNEQHNPGQPLHWNRGKSSDEADTMLRHFLQRGMKDTDGIRHSAKLAWRALALLQKELEEEMAAQRAEGCGSANCDEQPVGVPCPFHGAACPPDCNSRKYCGDAAKHYARARLAQTDLQR